MINRLYLLLVAALVALLWVACEKDENKTQELSAQEAKLALNSFSTDIRSEMQALENHAGMQALERVIALEVPIGEVSAGFRHLNINDLLAGKNPFAQSLQKGQLAAFDFEQAAGTYTYHTDSSKWQVEKGLPKDRIVVLYPTAGSPYNNARWEISALQEVEVQENGQSYLDLALARMELYVADVLVLQLAYDSQLQSAEVAQNMQLKLLLPPYSISMSAEEGATSSALAMGLQNDQRSLLSFDTKIHYAAASKELPSLVEATLQYGQLRMEGKLDFAGLFALGFDATPEKVNEKIDIRLYAQPSEAKVGNIILGFTTRGAVGIIRYNDGSQEPAEKYLAHLYAQMGGFLEQLLGNTL